jgi:hypothetical protein
LSEIKRTRLNASRSDISGLLDHPFTVND